MNRNALLTSPPDELIDNCPCDDLTLPDNQTGSFRSDDEALWNEASASSAIEGLTDRRSVSENQNALTIALQSRLPVGENMLLAVHKTVMRRRPDKSPGAYRQVNVRVGSHVAPHHARVPILMDPLLLFMSDANICPTLRAGYGHLWFETIHPFADGNGRAGRAMVCAILNRPWSEAVLPRRQQYYRLLSEGDVSEWLQWFSMTLAEAIGS